MNKKRIIVILTVAFFSFLTTSLLKVYVKNFALSVEDIARQNNHLINEVQVLKAEIAHLSNQDRIGRLAKVHLKLDKVKTDQIRHLVDKREEVVASQDVETQHIVNVEWRYKSRDKIFKLVKFTR